MGKSKKRKLQKSKSASSSNIKKIDVANVRKNPATEPPTPKKNSRRGTDRTGPKSSMLKIIAVLMVLVGIVLLFSGFWAVIRSYVEPAVDNSLVIPTFDKMPEFTNADSIQVTGNVTDVATVGMYVNDRWQHKTTSVVDGKFAYDFTFPFDGEYKFEAVSVKGRLLRKRSAKSPAYVVVVDRVAPTEEETSIDYKSESSSEEAAISVEVEPYATVTLKNGDNEFSARANEKGEATVNVKLVEGQNDFAVTVTDRAGNSTQMSKKVSVKYVPTVASIDGNGVSDSSTLPVAAGEMDAALAILRNNELMVAFAVVALLILTTNIFLVRMRLKTHDA